MRARRRQGNGCAPRAFHRCGCLCFVLAKSGRLPYNSIMKTLTRFTNCIQRSRGRCAFFSLLITCFAFPPMAKAVVPPPDGGYPNFTTAEGQQALFSLTTGSANTAVGWFSLFSNAAGSFNTATGAGSLLFNTADAIRHLARLRFYSTPPASTTPPSELPPF